MYWSFKKLPIPSYSPGNFLRWKTPCQCTVLKKNTITNSPIPSYCPGNFLQIENFLSTYFVLKNCQYQATVLAIFLFFCRWKTSCQHTGGDFSLIIDLTENPSTRHSFINYVESNYFTLTKISHNVLNNISKMALKFHVHISSSF